MGRSQEPDWQRLKKDKNKDETIEISYILRQCTFILPHKWCPSMILLTGMDVWTLPCYAQIQSPHPQREISRGAAEKIKHGFRGTITVQSSTPFTFHYLNNTLNNRFTTINAILKLRSMLFVIIISNKAFLYCYQHHLSSPHHYAYTDTPSYSCTWKTPCNYYLGTSTSTDNQSLG